MSIVIQGVLNPVLPDPEPKTAPCLELLNSQLDEVDRRSSEHLGAFPASHENLTHCTFKYSLIVDFIGNFWACIVMLSTCNKTAFISPHKVQVSILESDGYPKSNGCASYISSAHRSKHMIINLPTTPKGDMFSVSAVQFAATASRLTYRRLWHWGFSDTHLLSSSSRSQCSSRLPLGNGISFRAEQPPFQQFKHTHDH